MKLMMSVLCVRLMRKLIYIKKSLNLKGTYIGIIEKAKETSWDSGMHDSVTTVLHEQWMCLGMQRHTHITLCNLVTI